MSPIVLILALTMPPKPAPYQQDVTVLTCTSPEPFRKRPDFLSATPTYGPEGLWIVVLRGGPPRSDLTRRVPPPNRIGNP